MGIADYLLLALLVSYTVLALRSSLKKHRCRACCGSCSSCRGCSKAKS